MRVNLLKRMENSVTAFALTVQRQQNRDRLAALHASAAEIVPTRDAKQRGITDVKSL